MNLFMILNMDCELGERDVAKANVEKLSQKRSAITVM